jgi:Flp pilus assembly pilin Flp
MIKMLIYKGGEQEMKRNLERGQSILEYTLVLGAVIAVIVLVMFRANDGVKDKVKGVYDNAAKAIGYAGEKMTSENAGVFYSGTGG